MLPAFLQESGLTPSQEAAWRQSHSHDVAMQLGRFWVLNPANWLLAVLLLALTLTVGTFGSREEHLPRGTRFVDVMNTKAVGHAVHRLSKRSAVLDSAIVLCWSSSAALLAACARSGAFGIVLAAVMALLMIVWVIEPLSMRSELFAKRAAELRRAAATQTMFAAPPP